MENNLKYFRKKAGLTQKEAAIKVKTTQQRISQYEGAESLGGVTVGLLYSIANAYGVTINDIIYPLNQNK